MPTCLLIRHGRTDANAGGVLAGWTPGVGLDDVGIGQANALGEVLRSVTPALLVSSPLERCRQTAAVLRDTAWPRLDITVEERIGECRYGEWTGRSLKELAEEPMWRTVQVQPSAARFPDGNGYEGESLAGMSARMLAAVRDYDARVRDERGEHAIWVLVSHGDPIKAVLADAGGAHIDSFQRYVVSPASVSAVRYTGDRPFVLATNASGNGLGDLLTGLARPPEAGGDSDAAVGGGR